MKYTFIRLVLTFFLFLAIGCSDKKSNDVIYKKILPVNEDATKAWLRNVDNYKKDKNYLSIFYKFYEQKLKDKNFLEAAEVLDFVCVYLADSYDFNETFMSLVKEFNTKYRKEVPALKSTFVDAYLANFYFDKYDLVKAGDYFKKITQLEPNDYNSCYNTARAYYDLSYVYYITGKQNLSLIANQKSHEYFSKIDNPKGLAFVYSNYANIYTAVGDKKRAVENADKAIKAYKTINNTYNVYIGLINKISIYDYMNDERKKPLIDSVYQAFVESKEQSNILKIKIYDFKVENLVSDNKLTDAKIILDTLKPIVEKLNSDDLSQEYKVTYALYEIKNNQNYSNFKDIENAIPTLVENKQYEKAMMFYNVLENNAIKNNDFKSAFRYETEKQIITDSIASLTTKFKVAELETIYQSEKKQQQIQLQEKSILNKNTTIALLTSLFVGLFLTVVVYITKQKQKKLKLEKLNAQQYTKQLLEKTEEERKRIASDLHDSVSHELLSLKNSFIEKTDLTNQKIDSIINDIRIISRNLHPIMFDKIGLKSSLEQMVERTQSVNEFMVTAEIDYKNSLSCSDELQVYRIIQEALSNIIKYANAVAAKITIKEINDYLTIEIKDNGKGFNFEETIANSDAFGLHNIIERSRAIGGQAKITSDANGTIVYLKIKKSI